MSSPIEPRAANNDKINITDTKQNKGDNQGDDDLTPDTRADELGLWSADDLQVYCLDHFLMECESYHEQENDRYKKLVTHEKCS